MSREVVILIAEDDLGHFVLTKRYFQELGLCNEIIRLADGQAALDFFSIKDGHPETSSGKEYVLMLDIRMQEPSSSSSLQTASSTSSR